MSDLRERLAARLHHVFWTGAHDRSAVPEFVYGDVTDSDRRLADECIRQMEWVRLSMLNIAGDAPDGMGGGHNCDEACYYRMKALPTNLLAPDDWRPE